MVNWLVGWVVGRLVGWLVEAADNFGKSGGEARCFLCEEQHNRVAGTQKGGK